MHAHDQTLLARLGFQDPDRKTPDHDLACRYLSQREQLRKIAALYCPFDETWSQPVGHITFDMCITGSASLEDPITKGIGQYKTHVGFLDLVTAFTFINTTGTIRRESRRKIIIEVKIQPIDISTILRQLNLYKEHVISGQHTFWLLATAFPLNTEEVKSLGDVKHVYLDQAYKAYADQPVAESAVI